MPQSGKLFRRALLYCVTALVSVVVAACYGMAYTFRMGGRVVDRETGAGVPGIQVNCRSASGEIIAGARTDGQGDWWVDADNPGGALDCETLEFRDVDGAANCGEFSPVELPGDDFEPGATVEMGR